VNDAQAREQNMTAKQCLAFHQSRSKPVMETLKIWLQAESQGVFGQSRKESKMFRVSFYSMRH
jgi:hypothetical protein